MKVTRRQSMLWAIATGIDLKVCAQESSSLSTLPSDSKSPKHLQRYLAQPRLVGTGTFSVWGLEIYEATLWSVAKTFNPEQWSMQPFALELRYARGFDGKDIAKRSVEEIDKQSILGNEKYATWLKTLEVIFPDVRKNQTITGIYAADQTAHFLLDGKFIGSIHNAELSQRFFAIWLSPKTSAPKLRMSLLSGTTQTE
jgi:hypothetical protein